MTRLDEPPLRVPVVTPVESPPDGTRPSLLPIPLAALTMLLLPFLPG